MITSPQRAAGTPNSVRALNSVAARTWAICVSPRNPNGIGASARASRLARVRRTSADALFGMAVNT